MMNKRVGKTVEEEELGYGEMEFVYSLAQSVYQYLNDNVKPTGKFLIYSRSTVNLRGVDSIY